MTDTADHGEEMEEPTRKEFNRVYDRIDRQQAENSRQQAENSRQLTVIAGMVRQSTEDISRFERSVEKKNDTQDRQIECLQKDSHGMPCMPCVNNTDSINDLKKRLEKKAETEQAEEKEVKRDWRQFVYALSVELMKVGGGIAIGALALKG